MIFRFSFDAMVDVFLLGIYLMVVGVIGGIGGIDFIGHAIFS